MNIVFVRHGNDENDKLTKLGKLQAKLVSEDLTYENISKIYCSPKNRTLETAKIIARQLNIKDIIIDERITEREKKNDTMTKEEIAEFDANYLNPKFSRKNPEGGKEYVERIFSFIKSIKKENPKTSVVLIVGHSSMVYVLLAYMFKSYLKENMVWARLGNCSKLCLENV